MIGNLTVTDPDVGDVHTFVVHDARFEVVNAQLKLTAAESLDYESEPVVYVSGEATDAAGLSYYFYFTIDVLDVNDAPSDVDLMGNYVTENDSGLYVGYLSATDPDMGDTVTLTVNDWRFEVQGDYLYLKAGHSLDYETEPQVPITITATDSGGLTRSEPFTVYVYDVNEVPLDIQLDNTTVFEETPGAVIGNLTTIDDQYDNHWYSVDDPRFEVNGNVLQLAWDKSLDFENEMMVGLTVTVTDSYSQSLDVQFTIAVLNVNEAPTAAGAGGTLQAQDDGTQITYSGSSYNASTAFDSFGNSVTVWEGAGDQGWGIYGRLYDSNGNPFGNAIRLDDGLGSPYYPAVAMDPWGNFVAVWNDYRDDGFGNWGYHAYARGFAWGGMPMGDAVRVSDYDGSFAGRPTLVASDTGDYLLVWSAYTPDYMGTNLYARRIDSWGFATTSQVQLNSNSGYHYLAYYANAADVDQNGNYVVGWQDSTTYEHVVRQFDWFGNPLGGEVSFASGSSGAPALAIADTGEFVAAWEDASNIYFQQFDAGAMLLGGSHQVNTTTGYHTYPAVAVDGQGRFAVSWLDTYDYANAAVYGRWYNASGAAITEQTLINEVTGTGYIYYGPHVTANQQGRFAVTWSGYDTFVRTFEFSTAGVPNEVSLWQSTPLTLDLSQYFDDPDFGDVLTFTVESNDDATALSTMIDGSDLILDALTGNSLTLNLTIRATDAEGLFAEIMLVVVMNS